MSTSDKSKDKNAAPGETAGQMMWGGRFGASPDRIMQRINASIGFDKRLWREDLDGSLAHAHMLAKQDIITDADLCLIEKGLHQVAQEIEAGEFSYDPALEDIHMHVEARLKELIGAAAGRLHTARSRNDQVATDFKLWVRRAMDEISAALKAFQTALVDQATIHADTIMPGFTHLQTAQPVTLGHHLMAYFWMAERDVGRFHDARTRLNECPLGAAALAGTSFPIDRMATAQALGFDKPTENSLDSVSDRDFALEFLSAASICALHLSRMAEEMIIWASQPYGFLILSDRFSTGSSIMPQKRNPDAAELTKAKAGRILGNLQALASVMKGLPLAYAKDMQEDKEPVFDAFDALALSLAAMTGMVEDLTVRKDALRASAAQGFSTATDLADWLVRALNLPFRDAHHITGQIVRVAEEKGVDLDALNLEDMQSIDARITQDVFSVLSVEDSVNSRKSYGGTAPHDVARQIARAREIIL